MNGVLLINDDHEWVKIVARSLVQEGFEVMSTRAGRDGLRLAQETKPALILLARKLPDIEGADLCRELRSREPTRRSSIFVIGTRAEEVDEIICLTLGADEYIDKSLSMRILTARVHARLRSHRLQDGEESQVQCESQGVAINRRQYRALYRGRDLRLTPTELRLLESLVRHPGRIFTRSDLIDAAVGSNAMILEGTINVYIRSIRRKLGEGAYLIETVRSIGYRFRDSYAAAVAQSPWEWRSPQLLTDSA